MFSPVLRYELAKSLIVSETISAGKGLTQVPAEVVVTATVAAVCVVNGPPHTVYSRFKILETPAGCQLTAT